MTNAEERRNWKGTLLAILLVLPACGDREGVVPAIEAESTFTEVAPVKLPAGLDLKQARVGEVYQSVCAACHGQKGEGNPALKSPSIGGMPSWYILEQTAKFKSGLRGAHPEDTTGALMRAIAAGLSDEQLAEAATFAETLPEGKTEKGGDSKSVDRGRYIFANECMACHRFTGRGEVVFHSAPLTTLNREYLVDQLKKYRDGWRGSEVSDFYGQKMVKIAETLSDQSIEDVVNYIGALAHGDDPRPAMEY